MYEYYCLNPISAVGLDKFPAKYENTECMQEADAILVRSADMHNLEVAEKTAAVARAGAGVNNIPLEKMTKKGVVVFNTPGANANGVKEMVIAGMLLASRDIIGGIEWLEKQDVTEDIAKRAEKQKKQFAGCEISGKKLGIIGLGAIGVRVANAAIHLGMEVYGYDPYISVDAAWNLSRSIYHINDINMIYRDCDYITIHVPLTDETRHTFDSEAFGLMQKGTVVINFARGELVDNAALFEAIAAGVVKRYITDFGTEELLNKDKITVFPHVGGSTAEAELNCAIMAGKTIRQFMETGEITNSVNFPNVHQALTAPYRITLINKNVPNIVAKISTAVSDLGINIDNIINRSKGDYAYTLLDLDETDKAKIDHLVANFESSDNIVRVRLITKK